MTGFAAASHLARSTLIWVFACSFLAIKFLIFLMLESFIAMNGEFIDEPDYKLIMLIIRLINLYCHVMVRLLGNHLKRLKFKLLFSFDHSN
ncbi:MAG: hypothetical protein CSA18_02035 [Deltaproteobacteria bacterium]|nr:MAG: hypothetical protein CSB21_01430 [Deltaproteobacteria bacterium]PIE74917.1 MAG: hypothetical protein CSA18_02035 [Deltaproteobacteria bacterium]